MYIAVHGRIVRRLCRYFKAGSIPGTTSSVKLKHLFNTSCGTACLVHDFGLETDFLQKWEVPHPSHEEREHYLKIV